MSERAEQVRSLRESGLTIQQIAKQLGLSHSWVRHVASPQQMESTLRTSREAKRRRSDGNCRTCGERLPYSGGRSPAVRECQSCSSARQRAQKRWTREAVVAAIQRFANANGRPPTSIEWTRAAPASGYPAATSCYRTSSNPGAPFQKWADAIEAAGFARPTVGRRSRSEAVS